MCNSITELLPANDTVAFDGDFNLPTVDWSADNSSKNSDVSCSRVFSNVCYSHGSLPFVTKPAHDDKVLDLVFSNDPNRIGFMQVCNSCSTCDSNAIKFDIVLNTIII